MKTTFMSFLMIGMIAFSSNAWKTTPVSGETSGTWDSAGSPYLVQGDCTVPYGTILTIEPGVTVILGENLSIEVHGQIIAVGTQNEHIIFQGPNESLYF